MEKTLWNSEWFCIICSKRLPNICLTPDDDKYDNSGVHPNIEGGTAEISFGYGSRHDQIENLLECANYRYIGCICDDCFDDKRSLIKRVLIEKRYKFTIKEDKND